MTECTQDNLRKVSSILNYECDGKSENRAEFARGFWPQKNTKSAKMVENGWLEVSSDVTAGWEVRAPVKLSFIGDLIDSTD